MILTREEYTRYEAELNALIDQCRSLLPSEELEHTDYYVQHSELEMALEGLCLTLIVHNAVISEELGTRLYRLGKALGLDQETVYDAEFWSKFEHFLERNKGA